MIEMKSSCREAYQDAFDKCKWVLIIVLIAAIAFTAILASVGEEVNREINAKTKDILIYDIKYKDVSQDVYDEFLYDLSERHSEGCYFPGCADSVTQFCQMSLLVSDFNIDVPNQAGFEYGPRQDTKYEFGYNTNYVHTLDGVKVSYTNSRPELVDGAKYIDFYGEYCDAHINEASSILKKETTNFLESQAGFLYTWGWKLMPYNYIIICMVISLFVVVMKLFFLGSLDHSYEGVFVSFVLPLLPLVAIVLLQRYMQGGWKNFLVLVCSIFLNYIFVPIGVIFSALFGRKKSEP